jgi:hypothetical protein
LVKKSQILKILVEIINSLRKRSIFYFMNIVLPTRWNSSPLVFAKFTSRFIDLSSRYRRVTSRITCRRTDWLFTCRWIKNVCRWMNYVWIWFAMVIADSLIDDNANVTRREGSSMNLDVNVRKNQRLVCNIHGEEFQRVGRTIFIKSKILLFPKFSKFLLFLYQVILLLSKINITLLLYF